MTRLIGIALAAAVGAWLLATPVPVPAQLDQDMEKVELMLHGLIAVHSSSVMAMKAYDGRLLTKEEAAHEVARNKKHLALLSRCGMNIMRGLSNAEADEQSFIQDYLQVCNYLDLSLESLTTFVDKGDDLDRRLFDRYHLKVEEAMTRLLQN